MFELNDIDKLKKIIGELNKTIRTKIIKKSIRKRQE